MADYNHAGASGLINLYTVSSIRHCCQCSFEIRALASSPIEWLALSRSKNFTAAAEGDCKA